jgi:catechol 2,3-dioxygenase-like lactoylglutathione lyase family enzyme
MDKQGQNEGFRVLEEFVCEAIHNPRVPPSPSNKRSQEEGVRMLEEPALSVPIELAPSLLVLRCKDVEATRRFYERVGLVFVREKHGAGPEHYAWANAGFVLELYPTAQNQAPDNVRLGFSTPLLADLAGNLRHDSEVTVLRPPSPTADRLVMLLQDPDGRKVEISQILHR